MTFSFSLWVWTKWQGGCSVWWHTGAGSVRGVKTNPVCLLPSCFASSITTWRLPPDTDRSHTQLLAISHGSRGSYSRHNIDYCSRYSTAPSNISSSSLKQSHGSHNCRQCSEPLMWVLSIKISITKLIAFTTSHKLKENLINLPRLTPHHWLWVMSALTQPE